MEIHYSYEDYEDPEGTMLAHREQLGVPPPIPLAEPWELGPPVLIRDEPSWPMTNHDDWPVPTKPSGGVDFGQEDEVANLIAADWYDDVEGLIADEIEDRRGSGVTAADAVEDGVPGAAKVLSRVEERLRVLPPRAMDGHDELLAEGADSSRLMRLTDRTVRREVVEVTVDRVGGGSAWSVVAGGPGRSGPAASTLGPWGSLNSSDGPVVGSASDAAVRPPARDLGIQG